MRNWIIIIFCLLAGAFCACNQGKETNTTVTPAVIATGLPENTKAPSITAEPENKPTVEICPTVSTVPTEVLTLSPTPEPADELIPIDEEHFTSADFRNMISKKYDKDGDGFLSQTERESVFLIHWDYFNLLKEGIVVEEEAPLLDGLEYFPNLRFLTVREAGQVVFQGHPSIRGIQVKGSIAYLHIEQCPSFQFISGYFSIDSCYISDAAPEILIEDSYNYKSILYGGLYIYNPELFSDNLTAEEEKRILGREPLAGWLEETETGRILSKEPWESYLLGQEINLYEVSVIEETEEGYDVQGEGGWLVIVDHYDSSDMGVDFFPLDTDEIPTAGKIHISIGEISKVIRLNYLSDLGCILLIECNLNVVYQGKSGEELLGVIRRELYECFIGADSTVLIPYQSWKNISGSGGEVLSIDGEHFSSGVFQRYIEARYNVDYAEGLSVNERESVIIMDFSGTIRFDGETLDGLEYFPNLTDLYLGNTGTLIVENHPSLEIIGGEAKGLKKLVIRNCPELERIDFDLSAVEEVVIEGCGKLK